MGVSFQPNPLESYVASYAHLLWAELTMEPGVEQDPAICPERILIHFAMVDVTIVGSGLKRLFEILQRAEVGSIKAVSPSLANPGQPYVQSIELTPVAHFTRRKSP